MLGFSKKYWLLNLIQVIEQLAWSSVILITAIYVAQKDVAGGLHWQQSVKGQVFFLWAMVQNLVPVFFGSMADRYGRKKVLILSFILSLAGYVIMGTQREFFPFMFGTLILGAGMGLFNPSILGMLSNSMEEKISNTGWAIFIMLLNTSVMIAPFVAKSLQSMSWPAVFLGSAVILSINFILAIFVREEKANIENAPKAGEVIRKTLKGLSQPRVAWFIVIMSGFIMIYLQFYETLPNFLYDWTDSRAIVKLLNLPAWMLMETPSGKMIDYRYLYSINSAFIVAFVVVISRVMKHIKFKTVFVIGVALAAFGLFVAGFTYSGFLTIFGMTVYTFGEMIINPKIRQYMASLTGVQNKSAYLGYMYFSYAVGLGGGSLLGGYLYEHLSEKSTLAEHYLKETLHFTGNNLKPAEYISKLMEIKGINYADATDLLWKTYHPQQIWYIFLMIGIFTISGLWVYFARVGEK